MPHHQLSLKDKLKNNMELFGVKIAHYDKQQILQWIDSALDQKSKCLFIVTLNNEILLKAEHDLDYRKILNGADIRIIDTFGIKLVSFLKGRKVGERIAGADLAGHILETAKDKNLKVGIIIKQGGFSTKQDVLRTFDNMDLFVLEYDETQGLNEFILQNKTTLANLEILFVGTGAPVQEQLIDKLKNVLDMLRLGIGVGGTIDYWTGKKKRAPHVLRAFGFEWLWRLLCQLSTDGRHPSRAKRVWNATAVFLWKSLTNK